MKTKDKALFFGPIFLGSAVIVAIILVFDLRLYQKEGDIAKFGYIPENEIQVTKWIEDNPGVYHPETSITVVSDNGDTLKVVVFPAFPGSFLVVHKDSYPSVIGKKVFVKMTKRDGTIEITEASLKPFEK